MNSLDKNVNTFCNNVGDTFVLAQEYFSKDEYSHMDDTLASDIVTSLKSSHDLKEFVNYLKSHKRLEDDAYIAILTEIANVQNMLIVKIKKQLNRYGHASDTLPLPKVDSEDNLVTRLQVYQYALRAIVFVDTLK